MEPEAKTGQMPLFIFKFLWPTEILSLAAAITGITLKYLQLPGADEILLIGMSGLSAVYFLTAYKPPVETKDGASSGLANLFTKTILPKFCWIACSVNIIGSLFGILHLNGAGEMLMVGSSVLAAGILLSIYFITTGSEQAPNLINLLYRAAPILIFGIYMFMNLPPK